MDHRTQPGAKTVLVDALDPGIAGVARPDLAHARLEFLEPRVHLLLYDLPMHLEQRHGNQHLENFGRDTAGQAFENRRQGQIVARHRLECRTAQGLRGAAEL